MVKVFPRIEPSKPLDNEKPSFAEFLHPSRIYFRYNGLKGGVESAHALNDDGLG